MGTASTAASVGAADSEGDGSGDELGDGLSLGAGVIDAGADGAAGVGLQPRSTKHAPNASQKVRGIVQLATSRIDVTTNWVRQLTIVWAGSGSGRSASSSLSRLVQVFAEG